MSLPIEVTFEAALGEEPDSDPAAWTWIDFSTRLQRGQIGQVSRGRADEQSTVAPSGFSGELRNQDGALTPDLATSTYYPNVRLGVPVRYSVDGPNTALVVPGDEAAAAATTPDHASLDITGDIDIRVDIDLPVWTAENVSFEDVGPELIIKGSGTLVGGYALAVYSDSGSLEPGWLSILWDPTASTVQVRTSTVKLPKVTGRLALRATLDVNNGAAGHTVTFYTSDSIDGTWTQLGDPVVTAGTTDIATNANSLVIGPTSLQPRGRILAAQVRDGIGGTIVANPDFTAQTAGASSFADSTGKTWTIGAGSSLSKKRTRFIGFVGEWAPSWPFGVGTEARVAFSAAGVLRRLRQGNKPLLSAVRRLLDRHARTVSSTFGYWPLEDEAGATQAASFGPGAADPAAVSGTVTFGATSGFVGSDSGVSVANGATLTAPVNGGVPLVGVFVNLASAPGSAQTILQARVLGGTVTLWSIAVDGTNVTITGTNGSGTSVVSDTEPIADFFDGWVYLDFRAATDGGNVDWTVRWTQVAAGATTHTFDGTYAGTLGGLTGVVLPGGAEEPSFLHLQTGAPFLWTALEDAALGHAGETAGERIERLCGEEGVTFARIGYLENTPEMGAQTSSTFGSLLEECAAVDQGILSELREVPGICYRTRESLYNQSARLTIDASPPLVNPFLPVRNDQAIRNDVTASRPGGSSAQVVDQDSIDADGRYDESVTTNVETDPQLPDQAGWRVHLGTWPGMRYPKVTVQLHRADDDLVEAWLDADLGDVIEVSGLPASHPTDTVSLIAQGYAEVLQPFRWEPTINCTPAGPYTVGTLDDDTESTSLARLDSDGSTLNTSIDSDDTSLSIATASGPLWTTDADYYPMDIFIGGERMTVTAVSGASSPQTFTVTRSVNGVVKSHSSGAEMSLADPFVLVL